MTDCRDDSAVLVECFNEVLRIRIVRKTYERSLASWKEDATVFARGKLDTAYRGCAIEFALDLTVIKKLVVVNVS